MTDRRAEEGALVVGDVEEPACPAPRIAADLWIGQVAHDGSRLVARSRSAQQLDPFLVRYETFSETEMEKVARHDVISSSFGRKAQGCISFREGTAFKHKNSSR
jgi:hypothetical protein